MTNEVLLPLLLLVAALLYSSVGHGGASGYLAVMALFSVAPTAMKPVALLLNLGVAGLGFLRYSRAGFFSWKIFWPFAVISIPFSFVGGIWKLPNQTYKLLLGTVLVFAAIRLAINQAPRNSGGAGHIPLLPALAAGAAIGLLSGLTGVGGGIFLSPLLLFMEWADVRQAAGVSAAFIFVNSIAGLAGLMCRGGGGLVVPKEIGWWMVAVLIGGLIGTELGTRRFTPLAMRRMLALVLIIAGAKMLLGK
jgi:uncharacterized membrane protein YfcA